MITKLVFKVEKRTTRVSTSRTRKWNVSSRIYYVDLAMTMAENKLRHLDHRSPKNLYCEHISETNLNIVIRFLPAAAQTELSHLKLRFLKCHLAHVLLTTSQQEIILKIFKQLTEFNKLRLNTASATYLRLLSLSFRFSSFRLISTSQTVLSFGKACSFSFLYLDGCEGENIDNG